MSMIYLFGFDAFDGGGRNASWEAVQEVPDEMGGVAVVKRKLPVVWGEPFRVVQETVTEQPAAIIAV